MTGRAAGLRRAPRRRPWRPEQARGATPRRAALRLRFGVEPRARRLQRHHAGGVRSTGVRPCRFTVSAQQLAGRGEGPRGPPTEGPQRWRVPPWDDRSEHRRSSSAPISSRAAAGARPRAPSSKSAAIGRATAPGAPAESHLPRALPPGAMRRPGAARGRRERCSRDRPRRPPSGWRRYAAGRGKGRRASRWKRRYRAGSGLALTRWCESLVSTATRPRPWRTPASARDRGASRGRTASW
jgi:hypothetical protein